MLARNCHQRTFVSSQPVSRSGEGMVSRLLAVDDEAAEELLFASQTHLKRAEQALINAHHGTGIIELAAVIGRTEQRDQLPLGEELVSVFDDLMGSTDEIHVMLLQESRDHIRAKGEGDATIVFAPAGDVLVRIGP